MPTLLDELERHLTGRVCLVGVGNPDRADDGVGPWLAAAVRDRGYPDAVVAGRAPERWMHYLARGDFDAVVFLDAVDMHAAPGAAALLECDQIVARYPQVSTHTLSLGTLARLIEATGRTRVFLLGIQPQVIGEGSDVSPPVRTTAKILRDLLLERLETRREPLVVCGERS